MAFSIPMPMCIVNESGKIISANEHIGEVFLYDGVIGSDFFAITGVKVRELYDNTAASQQLIERNGRTFKMVPYPNDGNPDELAIIFTDVTTLEDLKDRYNNEKPCIAKIQIDNYDQLVDNSGSTMNSSLAGEIEAIIRKWGTRVNAQVTRARGSRYVAWFAQKELETFVSSRFSILDEVRALETGDDFPASLSIGIGVGGKTMAQSEEYADQALDLALGRGGDQAVIKRNLKVEYYGGTLQSVEKGNKGKSRIVGHVLKQLIDQSQRVFIMGHRNPDMDSFGSALGIHRICALSEKETYIVIDEYDESLEQILKQARETEKYKFINSEKAISLAKQDNLVIVVDTHKTVLTQCPELISICEKTVVIDHHRKMEGYIENPVLAYTESYASSASEMVTEILQFMSKKKVLDKLEAEALLAGMIIDSNGFSVKAGVRSFEAAAWLRRQGADPTEVKRFFQEDFSNVRLKARSITEAKFFDNGVAIATCEQVSGNAQLLCAQIADKLLTVKGTKVSFVVGRNKEMRTVISARSLGSVNVQVIMEKFNGGGHLTTAAAQVDMSIDEAVKKIMEVMEVQ